MKSINDWLNAYGESHQNKTNQLIHKVCVPIITFTVIGILWSLPFVKNDYFINWGTLFVLGCLVFYFTLSKKYFLGMCFVTLPMLGLAHFLNQKEILLRLSIILFVLAWIGQFYGHKIEGKKPSFFQDLVFLLIGPLWVLKSLFTKLGIASN